MARLHELEKEYILQNYSQFGPKLVSEELGRSQSTIINFAKKQNLKISDEKLNSLDLPKFQFNLDFSTRFDNISKELAYWLGFFWADGTIKGNTLSIEITEEDGTQLEPLFNQIYPFHIYKRSREGRKPQMSFSVNDKKIAEKLSEFGKYPHSSESHQKIFDYLNSFELQLCFLRGLIDGDGNFYVHSEYGQFSITSNINQDWTYLLEFLKDFNPNVKTEDRSTKYSQFRITGRDNLTRFIEFLQYDSIEIGLSRKKEKAKQIVELYENKIPQNLPKRVLQYSKAGEFIQEFSSTKEAGLSLGLTSNAIGNAIRSNASSGGYLWKYKE